MIINVKVKTSARETKIDKNDNIWKISLNVPPEKGKANKELIKILAKHFKVSKLKISILKGLKSHSKIVEVLD